MSWFGGSRMHVDTPVIKRLCSLRKGTEVLLFVRFEGESYTCLGRIKPNFWSFNSVPISCVWTLLDHEALSGTPYFKRVLALPHKGKSKQKN